MQYFIQLIDKPNSEAIRKANLEAHWDYFDAQEKHFIARGMRTTEEGKVTASVVFVDFETSDGLEAFLKNEPFNQAGLFEEIIIHRWQSGLTKRQRDFNRDNDLQPFLLYGIGKPNSHAKREELLQAHLDYFKPYEEHNFIVRGPLFNDQNEWAGSGNLLALKDRQAIDDFLTAEPYTQAGLYERIEIHPYRLGGRPGQIV